MHTVIAYISPVWDIIVAVWRRWFAEALLWQSWVTLAMRAYTEARGRWTQTDRQSDRGWGKKREREKKKPRVNSAPWTATTRHLSRQHLFAFISRRWITYSRQSQCRISTLVRNVTIIGVLSQVLHFILVPYFSFFNYFSQLLPCFSVNQPHYTVAPCKNEWVTHFFSLCMYLTRSAVVLLLLNTDSQTESAYL